MKISVEGWYIEWAQVKVVVISQILSASTHYEVLGILPDASETDIKRAFRRFAMATHPDKNPGDSLAHARFIRVQQAYETLADPAKRHNYDLQLLRLSNSTDFWNPNLNAGVIISQAGGAAFPFYGHAIPAETINRATKEADRISRETGMSHGEAFSRLLLDPFIRAYEEKLRKHPRDLALLVNLAEHYFYTYRSAKALEYYSKAFALSDTQSTAEQTVHLGTAYFYAGEYWGGIERLGQFLASYPNAEEQTRTRWAEDADRLIRSAQKIAVDGLPPDAQLELSISFFEKRVEFGYEPSSRDLKAIGNLALKVGRLSLAAEYLRRAGSGYLLRSEVSALMRSFASAGLEDEAIAIGIKALPKNFLSRTLKDSEKRLVRALAEVYEKSGRIPEALAIYGKLTRYKDASAGLKKKVDKLCKMTKNKN